jgi:hypothetical protein
MQKAANLKKFEILNPFSGGNIPCAYNRSNSGKNRTTYIRGKKGWSLESAQCLG